MDLSGLQNLLFKGTLLYTLTAWSKNGFLKRAISKHRSSFEPLALHDRDHSAVEKDTG